MSVVVTTINLTPSVIDRFTIGVGPSGSHTVRPMRAAADFADLTLARGGPVPLSNDVLCKIRASVAVAEMSHHGGALLSDGQRIVRWAQRSGRCGRPAGTSGKNTRKRVLAA